MTANDAPQQPGASAIPQDTPPYERPELLARRASLSGNYAKTQEDFDKVLLTIATGGLVLSVGFIEKIVTLATACCTALLVCSWGAFVLGLMAALASHWSAAEAHLAAINAIDENLKLKPPAEAEKRAECLRLATKRINIASGICTASAVVLLVVFAGLNTLSQHNKVAHTVASSCVPVEMLSELAKRYESKTSESGRSPSPAVFGLEEEGRRSTSTSTSTSPATSDEVGSAPMAKQTRNDGITPPPPPPRPEAAKKGLVPPPPAPRPTAPAPSTKPTEPKK